MAFHEENEERDYFAAIAHPYCSKSKQGMLDIRLPPFAVTEKERKEKDLLATPHISMLPPRSSQAWRNMSDLFLLLPLLVCLGLPLAAGLSFSFFSFGSIGLPPNSFPGPIQGRILFLKVRPQVGRCSL